MTMNKAREPGVADAASSTQAGGLPLVANHIGGKIAVPAGGRRQAVSNPALGEACAEVVLSGAADVDAAVAAARAAFPAWAATPPLRRARLMNRLLALFNENKKELGAAITREHGKVLSDAV
ncbi:MAG: aldehyde dehydrogenase family protein, partial [Betaproteobacteria bacterium]|nr:aldehyde dehydrogenase family protein [Betaproteobacteria bacterium]